MAMAAAHHLPAGARRRATTGRGSGWIWLASAESGRLEATTTGGAVGQGQAASSWLRKVLGRCRRVEQAARAC